MPTQGPRESYEVTDMTTLQQHLGANPRESHRAHVIVTMTVVVAALISAAATWAGRSTSSALLSAPRHEAVANAPASEAPVMPQSLGYLEFDWSTASGDVPGFAPLSNNSAAH